MTAVHLLYRCNTLISPDDGTVNTAEPEVIPEHNLRRLLDASLELNLALKHAMEVERLAAEAREALMFTHDDLDWLVARAEERGALWAMRAMREGNAALDPVEVCRAEREKGSDR